MAQATSAREPMGGLAERVGQALRPSTGTFVVALLILVLGFFLIFPILLIVINSFNTARDMFVGPRVWGLDNWRVAFDNPMLLRSLWHSIMIFGLTIAVGFPVAVLIAWTLARTRIPFSHTLEFMFWVSFMMPSISVTMGWIMLADPRIGMLNTFLRGTGLFSTNPLNIYSVPGIVWAHLMSNGISAIVMLLTPAFRNMDASLEEAGRVSGASTVGTLIRVTLPVMIPPMAVVFALQVVRVFQSFEIEQLLGVPFRFHVYSTMVYDLVRREPPLYGQATALASVTLLVIAAIIPIQRWLISRRRYTTVTGQFRPGLIDLGKWRVPVFLGIVLLLCSLIVAPALSLVLGSFMTRAGFFQLNPLFTLEHWRFVFTDAQFLSALRNTFLLALSAAVLSPLLFAFIAYVLVRTRWRGRGIIDIIIWTSAAVPGMLSGLGLLVMFLGTPGLSVLYGTLWALIIVTLLQGKTTGTQTAKGVFLQMGQEMEEAARVSGAGWFRTFFRIWIPLLMPTLVLLGTLNFVLAANTTSSIILLASRDTMTLSILALTYASPGLGMREEAGIVSLVIIAMTVGVALIARRFGLRIGIRHDRTATAIRQPRPAAEVTAPVAEQRLS